MINLSEETEALAQRIAAAQRVSVNDAVRQALEDRARAAGVPAVPVKHRRMSVEEMLAFGAEIAAMPVLDPRSAHEIMDDLNAI